jgi:glucose-1-phosphate cytidylyltransferase
MVETFQQSNAIASLLLVQPTASFDIVHVGPEGKVREVCALSRSDIWINGGFFVMRQEIFRYLEPGEELVREPFQRLTQQQALLAYKCTGFWQCMDTFKDKQRLEELNQEPGTAPWKMWEHGVSTISNHAAVLAVGV